MNLSEKKLSSISANNNHLDVNLPTKQQFNSFHYHHYKPFPMPEIQRNLNTKKNVYKSIKKPNLITKPSVDLAEPRTICDIDSSFYKIVEGRPILQFIDFKVYIRTLRDITLMKANTAYLKDQVIAIDASKVTEFLKYEKVLKIYESIRSSCVQFVKESYETARDHQDNAKIKTDETNIIREQLNKYSFSYVELRNKVDSLLSILESLTKYGSFLYSLSPTSWTEKNKHDFEGINAYFLKRFNAIDSCFTSPTKYSSFNTSVNNSVSIIHNNSPTIYLKEPIEIMIIYNDISKQCLDFLEIQRQNASIQKLISKHVNIFKDKTSLEIEEMRYLFNQCEKQIEWMEEKHLDYENKFKYILEDKFKNLYASYESIQLFTCIQYVHSNLFPEPEDPKDNMKTLVYDIEKMYFKLTFSLDLLSQDVVKQASNNVFSEDINKMKQAHKAKRILKESDLLRKTLYASFEPTRCNKMRIGN